jgi:hypothetical protein
MQPSTEQIGSMLVASEKLPVEERVQAHAEVLRLMHEALREIAADVRAIREGRPAPGSVARY